MRKQMSGVALHLHVNTDVHFKVDLYCVFFN